jgi:hypothetical protein
MEAASEDQEELSYPQFVRSKDRSLRQLLQGDYKSRVGLPEAAIFLVYPQIFFNAHA